MLDATNPEGHVSGTAKIFKTKGIFCKIFKTLELCLFGALGRHKPEAGGFCLYLSQLYAGCQAKEPQKLRFGEWDAHGKTTTEILHVVQNDGLGGGEEIGGPSEG